MKIKYEIEATYIVSKVLDVEVEKGKDPLDPANWGDIIDEYDADCQLEDVISAEEL